MSSTRHSKTLPCLALASALVCFGSAAMAASDTPVAQEAFVQAIDSRSGNALITARFDRKEWSALNQRAPVYQKLALDDGSLLLRDDGQEGDLKAYDGVYTAITKFDFDALLQQYQRIESLQTKLGRSALPLKIEGREIVGSEKLLSSSALLDAIKSGAQIPLLPIGIAAAINKEKSLMIRTSSVVQDPARTFNGCTGVGNPNGVWTFKHLVTEMANTASTGVTPEEFVRLWLSSWENPQTVNGWTVADRNFGLQSLILNTWEALSGGPGNPLDLDKAPFELIAIVNRVDLRDNFIYGGGSAGEGRFVFQVLDAACNPQQFTVIFEYGIEKNSCSAVKSWGQQWADLSSMSFADPAFNPALEAITESFVQAGAAPHKPNGSALNQLRTNEIAIGFPWELREFVISGSGWNQHLLMQNTVAQTPDISLNGTLTLRNFVNSGATVVPLRYPTVINPFRGGAAEVPNSLFLWNEPGILPRQLRHEFSLNTCNGCHAGETNTPFTHVQPGSIPVNLSGFLTGIAVVDPDGAPVRVFNDLARRATDLDALINSSCLIDIVKPNLLFPH